MPLTSYAFQNDANGRWSSGEVWCEAACLSRLYYIVCYISPHTKRWSGTNETYSFVHHINAVTTFRVFVAILLLRWFLLSWALLLFSRGFCCNGLFPLLIMLSDGWKQGFRSFLNYSKVVITQAHYPIGSYFNGSSYFVAFCISFSFCGVEGERSFQLCFIMYHEYWDEAGLAVKMSFVCHMWISCFFL